MTTPAAARHGQGQRQDAPVPGTGRPGAGTHDRDRDTDRDDGPGTLPFTGINPRLPILGGTMVGFGLVLLGLSNARRRRTSA